VRERRSSRLRRIDLKLVIAVLIGLVSVTGAVITWRSSQLGENATDKDRQAIAETVLQEQKNSDIETKVRDEQQAFAQYKEALTNASLLDAQAGTLDSAGLTTEAALARDQAGEQREIAFNLSSLTLITPYVKLDDKGLPDEFLIDKARSDLQRNDQNVSRIDPAQTVAQAADLRRQSQRLEGWTIPLVLAVVLLTIATITRREQYRPWIASAAVVIFVVSATIAFVGD
jgi:hypothetical protein